MHEDKNVAEILNNYFIDLTKSEIKENYSQVSPDIFTDSQPQPGDVKKETANAEKLDVKKLSSDKSIPATINSVYLFTLYK